MTYFTTAASAAIAAAVLALIALAALHILKPEVFPSRNMISQYALGRHGWVMALFFGAFAAASASCLLRSRACASALGSNRLGVSPGRCRWVGDGGTFPDGPGRNAARASVVLRQNARRCVLGWCALPAPRGGAPVSSVHSQVSHASLPLLTLTAVVWLRLVVVIAVMLMVGPGKLSNPDGPERFLGWPN